MMKNILVTKRQFLMGVFVSIALTSVIGQEFASTFATKIGIVRIYCNQPKIKHLESVMTNAQLPAVTRREAEDNLKKHLAERALFTKSIIDNFEAFYTITPVVYMPDSLYKSFVKGEDGVYFLDKLGRLDESIKLPEGKDYYLITQGNFDYDFRVMDAQGNPPPYPFPYKLKYGLFSKIRAMMGEEASMSVMRLQKQLDAVVN